jgi:hypothetical protein
MLLFTAADHGRVANGEITVTYRLWKRAHVKAGKTYATGFGDVFIEDVRVVPSAFIDAEDVRLSGCIDSDEVRRKAGEHTRTVVGPETLLHRVQFRYLGASAAREPDAAADPPALAKRLARLDRSSPHGAWTLQTLRLIAENPRVRARDLATRLGMETQPFKANVRKLKRLGLTRSFEVGYELTDLGLEVLRHSEPE